MHGLMHMPGTAARLAAGQRSLTPAECDSFREDGFVIVRSVFDPAEIAELRDGFDCLLDLLAPAAGGGAAKAALLPSIYFKVHAGSEDARATFLLLLHCVPHATDAGPITHRLQRLTPTRRPGRPGACRGCISTWGRNPSVTATWSSTCAK